MLQHLARKIPVLKMGGRFPPRAYQTTETIAFLKT